MSRRLVRVLACVALCGFAAAPAAQNAAMTRTAADFVAQLRPGLKAECVQPLESDDRLRWSYFPGRRKGIALKEMNAQERAAAFAMLRAALSSQGYAKTEGVIVLEGVLRRDPDLYYLTLFGTPSPERPWSWRFEGHHISLHFSSATGRLVSETPAFFGADPARVSSGPHAGLRVLASEEDLAKKLLGTFDARQRRTAVVSGDAPSDIRFGPGRPSVPEPAGLAAADMTEAQRTLLRELIAVYTGNLREDMARAQTAKIEKAGIEKVRFAWEGGATEGQGHYYRIQGPTFVIEYDNTQDRANHVHSVFRDLEDDFGGDALARHYAEGHAARP
jgi:hypothetical protein